MGQSGELVEQCPQDGTQDASINRVPVGEEQDQTQNGIFDLQYTISQKVGGGNVAMVRQLAVEDDQKGTTRSWAIAIVSSIYAREAAASCWGLALEGLKDVRSESGSSVDLEFGVLDESYSLLVFGSKNRTSLLL